MREGNTILDNNAPKPTGSEPANFEPACSQPAPEFPNQFCPVCSTRLESHRCKMICARCGYFMSCSEFE
jgi:predicted amidophosphoribosyltransferase